MQWKIGKVKITKVVELETVGSTRFILPLATNEEIQKLPWLFPQFANEEGRLKMSIHSLVVESSPGLILDHGLPYDRCLVGVVTDLDGWESLARHDVLDAGGMPRVLRTQVDVVLDAGACVLNLDAPGVVELGRHCDGACVGYGTAAAPAADAGLSRTVRWVDGAVCLFEGQETVPQARAPLAAGTSADRARVLCGAAAAAWATGLSPSLIAAGLQRFDSLPRD